VATANGPIGSPVDGPLRPYDQSQTFADATGDIVISPPCRAVRVAVGGTLVVTYANGTTDTITLDAGELLDLHLAKIGAASAATGISVFW
jgi:hypothetical protein